MAEAYKSIQNATDNCKDKKGQMLPEYFSPSASHVIVGRGRKIARHQGNCRMRAIIQANLQDYRQADKTTKSYIIQNIVFQLDKESPDHISLVKLDTSSNRWHAPPKTLIRATVAQAFRDALSGIYRSSKESKQIRRLKLQAGGIKGGGSAAASDDLSVSSEEGSRPLTIVSDQMSLLSAFSTKPQSNGMNKKGTNLRAMAGYPLDQRSTYQVVEEACALVNKTEWPSVSGGTYTSQQLSTFEQNGDSEAPLENLLTAPMPPDQDEDEVLLQQHLCQEESRHAPVPSFSGSAVNMIAPPSNNYNYNYNAFAASEQTSAFFLHGFNNPSCGVL